MREIKFRAWKKSQKQMFYPTRAIHIIDLPQVMLSKDEDVIMQFTGLFDKQGKEIYEGDILDCGQDPNAEVWWDEELGQFSISTYHATLSLCDNLRNAKIKGNKYENPELL